MVTRHRVLQLDVPRADAELAADLLWQAGPTAVGEADIEGDRVRLTADVADADRLAGLPTSWAVRVLEVDGDAYLDAWRAWAAPVRAGRHLVVHPVWLPRQDEAGDLTVLLDPAHAFGSGSHPTTRLVLAAVEARLRPGDRVLDVGTGSGVLAVAAALLGASRVVAVDVDPAAVEATVQNARLNGVEAAVHVSLSPVASVAGTFDLVLANIGAGVLRGLAPELVARVGPTGWLVLSGLLVEQADDVVACFAGFEEVERPNEDGWVAAVLRRPR